MAVILAPSHDGLQALLIRRAEREGDPWSGHIGLPGGRREAEDADRLDTAIRETEEEIGVRLPRAALLGRLDDLNPRIPTVPPLLISPYVFGVEQRPETAMSEEVSEVYWAELAELAAEPAKALVPIRGERVELPCFRPACLPGEHVVWGLTYRVLSALRPLLD